MRRLLIPRSPFGLFFRVAMLYAFLAAVTFLLHMMTVGATIVAVAMRLHLVTTVDTLQVILSAS